LEEHGGGEDEAPPRAAGVVGSRREPLPFAPREGERDERHERPVPVVAVVVEPADGEPLERGPPRDARDEQRRGPRRRGASASASSSFFALRRTQARLLRAMPFRAFTLSTERYAASASSSRPISFRAMPNASWRSASSGATFTPCSNASRAPFLPAGVFWRRIPSSRRQGVNLGALVTAFTRTSRAFSSSPAAASVRAAWIATTTFVAFF